MEIIGAMKVLIINKNGLALLLQSWIGIYDSVKDALYVEITHQFLSFQSVNHKFYNTQCSYIMLFSFYFSANPKG